MDTVQATTAAQRIAEEMEVLARENLQVYEADSWSFNGWESIDGWFIKVAEIGYAAEGTPLLGPFPTVRAAMDEAWSIRNNRQEYTITPDAACRFCSGRGVVVDNQAPHGSGLTWNEESFCECVLDQLPEGCGDNFDIVLVGVPPEYDGEDW